MQYEEACFRLLSENCPTKRAPDAGESGAIPSIFHASAFFQSDGVPPPAPVRVTQTVRRGRNDKEVN
jgi:hypothetical protein